MALCGAWTSLAACGQFPDLLLHFIIYATPAITLAYPEGSATGCLWGRLDFQRTLDPFRGHAGGAGVAPTRVMAYRAGMSEEDFVDEDPWAPAETQIVAPEGAVTAASRPNPQGPAG